ncbi:hypothetical protein NECAME_00262 [Necator americanus]|uniref:Uncharacterized protein n=1 Tax=Necator americanus TaxID=51031 RepID=W2TL89_NECAM|nr:hypothetical protein NECAME_00262 [Necator americanus]ETN81911.1 hypothetical protein NECAME_00262 [Necator americanus]
MACQASASEAVVLRLKSHDVSDVSLASSESSGCSSQRSSILRSPVNLEETPVLHGTESSLSTDPPKPEMTDGKESRASNAGTSSPTPAAVPPHLFRKNSKWSVDSIQQYAATSWADTFSLLRAQQHTPPRSFIIIRFSLRTPQSTGTSRPFLENKQLDPLRKCRQLSIKHSEFSSPAAFITR